MTADAWTYFLRQALSVMWRSRRLYLGSVLTVALALTLVGGAVIGRLNLHAVGTLAQSRSEITVYLDPGTSPAASQALVLRLKRLSGVQAAHFVSADQALSEMRVVLGPNAAILRQLGQNPFTAYIGVTVRPEAATAVARRARAFPQVAWVQDNTAVLERLGALVALAGAVGWGVEAAAVVVAAAVAAHVTRLAMWARREEIATLVWMGAAPWFIAMPFLLEGLILGAASGLVAAALLVASGSALSPELQHLLPFLPWQLRAGDFGAGAGMAFGLGVLASLAGSAVAVQPFRRAERSLV
ncbi:MAG: permease-like cell division protein FtsX [Firmicutes bacterium]|nr:hypothetical protein [Alicyclobacillaceae bacterium]MCL6498213.1 permease-like cell division protein FtsX [Bacillota bacterium]